MQMTLLYWRNWTFVIPRRLNKRQYKAKYENHTILIILVDVTLAVAGCSMKARQLISMKRVKGSRERKTHQAEAARGGGQQHPGGHSLNPYRVIPFSKSSPSVAAKNRAIYSVRVSVTMVEWSVCGLVLDSSLGSLGYQGVGVRYSLTPWIACALNCLDLRRVHSDETLQIKASKQKTGGWFVTERHPPPLPQHQEMFHWMVWSAYEATILIKSHKILCEIR